MERLLPFYISPSAQGWQFFTGFILSAVGNAVYIGILAAGVTLAVKAVL